MVSTWTQTEVQRIHLYSVWISHPSLKLLQIILQHPSIADNMRSKCLYDQAQHLQWLLISRSNDVRHNYIYSPVNPSSQTISETFSNMAHKRESWEQEKSMITKAWSDGKSLTDWMNETLTTSIHGLNPRTNQPSESNWNHSIEWEQTLTFLTNHTELFLIWCYSRGNLGSLRSLRMREVSDPMLWTSSHRFLT